MRSASDRELLLHEHPEIIIKHVHKSRLPPFLVILEQLPAQLMDAVEILSCQPRLISRPEEHLPVFDLDVSDLLIALDPEHTPTARHLFYYEFHKGIIGRMRARESKRWRPVGL